MPTLRLRDEDARLVALALAYHLARPGSELDPDTLQPRAGGLAAVQQALAPQLGNAQVELTLDRQQLHRLAEALLGLANELKQMDLAGGRTSVPGLAPLLARLFPEQAGTAGEGGTPLDLVSPVVMLRRRLEPLLSEPEPPAGEAPEQRTAAPEPRRWWRRRRGEA